MPPNNNTGSHRDTKTTDQFNVLQPTATRGKYGRCKWCKEEMSWNTTNRLRPHLLLHCKKYDAAKTATTKNQPSMRSFTKVLDLNRNELFALAIYTSTANFTMFKSEEWKAFFKKLGYTTPTLYSWKQPPSKDILSNQRTSP
jgi:hypothetical protein